MKCNFSLLAVQWMLVSLMLTAALVGTQTVRGHKAALLIIDVQDCFLPGGGLAVPEGEKVIPVINKLRADFEDRFSLVVLSQDWHCPDHVSFASQHPGARVSSIVNLTYNSKGALCYGDSVPSSCPYAVDCSLEAVEDLRVVPQILWPDHCIQNVTSGPTSAQIARDLTVKESDIIVRKGNSCWVDSYSAFYDNGAVQQTELNIILKQDGIELVVVTGLALDFCVYYTAKDAHKLGYKVLVVTDASRGVSSETTAAALKDMKTIGIQLIQAGDLEGALQDPSEATDPGTISLIMLTLLGTIFTAYLVLRR